MRPKTVIVVFVVAIAVLAVILLVKSAGVEDPGPPVAAIETNELPVAASNAVAGSAASTGVEAVTSEQERAARIDKEVEQINDAVGNGSDDPMSLVKITDRLTHPEREVREAAIRGARLLGDRAAIKNLKIAKDQLEDPRDKAAIMDVIEYLEMEREGEGPSTNSPPTEPGPGSQPRPAAPPASPTPPK